jgi:hypothetical protein
MPFLELVLASQLILVAADKAPAFNVEPTCRATVTEGMETTKSCENDEKIAQQQLSKEWGQFAVSDRTMCTDLVKSYDPSYVELLSCLEMMRDAKTPPRGQDATLPSTPPQAPAIAPQAPSDVTTGQGTTRLGR